MQFTPQQLAGAQRYGSKTRIGNWLEDLCIEDAKKLDMNYHQKAFNRLKMKLEHCTQRVRFFSSVMLQNMSLFEIHLF